MRECEWKWNEMDAEKSLTRKWLPNKWGKKKMKTSTYMELSDGDGRRTKRRNAQEN